MYMYKLIRLFFLFFFGGGGEIAYSMGAETHKYTQCTETNKTQFDLDSKASSAGKQIWYHAKQARALP